MKQYSNTKTGSFLPGKTIVVMTVIVLLIAMASSFKTRTAFTTSNANGDPISGDSIASVKAFMKVYKVLKSPRCMNCHPAGDAPLQGDDSHLHTMNIKRGIDGTGLYSARCSNCHQPANVPGLHTPPGNPKWQLPPAGMKMVFQGRTPRQLALQIMNYNQNGHKNKKQLLEHARDTLVKSGWNMGEGRTAPPLGYDDFVSYWDEWINKGGYAPR